MKRLLLLLVNLLVLGSYSLFESSAIGSRFEFLFFDQMFQFRGVRPPPSSVLIVAMDEASYSILGLPFDRAWPRRLHAKLLKRLKELGAKRAVMDILFLGPSSDPDADQELSTSISEFPTVLGVDTGSRQQGTLTASYTIEELLLPYEPFSSRAERLALVKMPDNEGYIRQMTLPRSSLTADLPVLYEAAAGFGLNGLQRLPRSNDLINYYGPSGTIPTYPYHQVVDPDSGFPTEAFKDKIVFVGLTARTDISIAQKDAFQTSFRGRSTFGVEIQATAAENLMASSWIRRLDTFSERALQIAIAAGFSLPIPLLTPLWGMVLLIISSALLISSSYILFLNYWFIPLASLWAIFLPITFLGSTLYYYLITLRAQRKTEAAFSLYLPPQMARQMRSSSDALKLGGREIIGTAMFTDIAGFTEISERMSATEVSEMLNSYFTEVASAIWNHNGTLIKFIGDAVFAIWGAPLPVPNPDLLATKAALEIQNSVMRFNAQKKYPPLITRIGVHSGSMVVGNLGWARKLDFTAIGDSINLASRLEGLNKAINTKIIISETVAASIMEQVPLARLGRVQVQGRRDPLDIFTPVSSETGQELLNDMTAALEYFSRSNFPSAVACFQRIVQKEGDLNGIAKFYLNLIAEKPGWLTAENWSGTVIFSEK